MDEADRANMEEERSLAEALRKRLPAGPAPTGWCLFCTEPVLEGARWCDLDCRADWSRQVDRAR